MLGGRAGEIVSRRETPAQCGRVGSPVHVYIGFSIHMPKCHCAKCVTFFVFSFLYF